jgi:transcriptional regulator with XRE-family HTH domain
MRGLTQAQLAQACGLTDSAIRNYELGNRTPGADQLAAIAKALDVAPEALIDLQVKSAREALEILFRLEEAFGLAPVVTEDGTQALTFNPKAKGAQKLSVAINAWQSQLEALNNGEITPEEYDAWKSTFKG